MFEKFIKNETVAAAKVLVKDNPTAMIVGAVILTGITIFAIKTAFPTTVVNNYVWTGGCWSPYHAPGGFIR